MIKPIFVPHISNRLMKFFNHYQHIIDMLFNIIKLKKRNIVDSYYYSIKNPPKNPNYKYTEKLYIGCIFYVLKHNNTWESFIGPIPGDQLNKRHNEYCGYHIYFDFYEKCLKKYLKTKKIKYLSIDSTISNNKNNEELIKHLPINKNRRGAKISTITDDIGSPIVVPIIADCTVADSLLAIDNINELVNNKLIINAFNKTNGNIYLLGDSGYDSSFVKSLLVKNNIKPIIMPNNRNTGKGKHQKINKVVRKKKRLSKPNRIKYKKRKIIENFFAILKRNTKINCVYEKTIRSFEGLVLFVFGAILLTRSYIT